MHTVKGDLDAGGGEDGPSVEASSRIRLVLLMWMRMRRMAGQAGELFDHAARAALGQVADVAGAPPSRSSRRRSRRCRPPSRSRSRPWWRNRVVDLGEAWA